MKTLLKNPPEIDGKSERDPQERAFWQDLLFLFTKILGVVLFFVVIFTFLFGITRVGDMDMASSVREGDLAVYNRLEKNYRWWDCIAVKANGKVQIRRVVAVEGDTVEIDEEGLKINGYLQSERYIMEETRRYDGDIQFPITLSEGQVFVLGDARYNATDSRVYGPVDQKDVLGKVMLLIRRRDF